MLLAHRQLHPQQESRLPAAHDKANIRQGLAVLKPQNASWQVEGGHDVLAESFHWGCMKQPRNPDMGNLLVEAAMPNAEAL